MASSPGRKLATGSDAPLAQVHNGLYNLGDDQILFNIRRLSGAFFKNTAASHPFQCFSQFRLEQDHQYDRSVLQDRSQEPVLQAEWNDICARYDAEIERQLKNLEQYGNVKGEA